MWRGAQHIAVYATNDIVAAHESNYGHMKRLIRPPRLAQNAAEHPVPKIRARHRPPPYASDATPLCRSGLPLLPVDPYIVHRGNKRRSADGELHR